jgi:hypothetical protein
MDVKRTMLMLLAVAACGAQPEPPAQGPVPDGERPVVIDMTGGGTPAIRGLIGERQRLGLTGAQVTVLDSLAIRLASANDSLRASMGEGNQPGRPPRPGTVQWERTLPALQTIAQNNRNASLLVQQVLTDDQRRIACEIQAEDDARRPRAPRPVRRPAQIGGRGRMRADSIAQQAQRGWPWCPATPPASTRR